MFSVCSPGPAGDCVRERQPGAGILPGGDQEERQAERRGADPHPAQPRAGAAAQSHHQRNPLIAPGPVTATQATPLCLRNALESRLPCFREAPL